MCFIICCNICRKAATLSQTLVQWYRLRLLCRKYGLDPLPLCFLRFQTRENINSPFHLIHKLAAVLPSSADCYKEEEIYECDIETIVNLYVLDVFMLSGDYQTSNTGNIFHSLYIAYKLAAMQRKPTVASVFLLLVAKRKNSEHCVQCCCVSIRCTQSVFKFLFMVSRLGEKSCIGKRCGNTLSSIQPEVDNTCITT